MNIVKDISLKGKQYIKPVATALAFTYLLSEFVCEVATVEGQTFTSSEKLSANETSIVFVDKVTVNLYQGYKNDSKVFMFDPYNPKRKMIRNIATFKSNGVGRVTQGYAWVICGPNSDREECDSEHFGPVSLRMIDGHVRCVLWPPNRAGFL